MPAVLTNKGKKYLLDKIVNKKETSDFILHLFINDIVPKKATTLSDLKEAQGFGYSERILYGIFWQDSYDGLKSMEDIFTFTGKAGKVYGYYITSDDVLIFVEKFKDGPYKVKNAGDQITIKTNLVLG